MHYVYENIGHKSYDLSQLSVLVVDDNKHMRTLLKDVLRALGIGHTYLAADGAEALSVLRDTTVDLIITDWNMTPLDGISLTETIRQDPVSKCPFVPIVMVTGHNDYARVMEAVNRGVNEFLAKPVSATALYKRIISVIERPRPFIRVASYTGPDRRRQTTLASTYAGARRRKSDTTQFAATPTNTAADGKKYRIAAK